jgi:hypothetical protein
MDKYEEAYEDLTDMIKNDKKVFEKWGKEKEAEAFGKLIEEIGEINKEYDIKKGE